MGASDTGAAGTGRPQRRRGFSIRPSHHDGAYRGPVSPPGRLRHLPLAPPARVARRRDAVRGDRARGAVARAGPDGARVSAVLRRAHLPRAPPGNEPRGRAANRRPFELSARDRRERTRSGDRAMDRSASPASSPIARAFQLERFRDYLALEAGNSGNTVASYLRDITRLSEDATSHGAKNPGPMSAPRPREFNYFLKDVAPSPGT